MRSKAEFSIVKGPFQELTSCSLNKLLENNLKQNASKPALIYKNNSSTFLEVNETSNQYARVILQEILDRSLRPNKEGDYIIGVCMNPSDSLVGVLLAIWKAGFAYVAIDRILTDNRINHIVKDSCPAIVICDDDVDQTLFEASTCIFNMNKLKQKALEMGVSNIEDSEMLNAGKDLAVILYTSGSTGIPKGVKLSHSALLNRLKWQWSTFPFAADETIGVFKSSLSFVDSVIEIWSALLYGLLLLVLPKGTTKDPEKLVNILNEYQIKRIMLVPTLLRNILTYLQMIRMSNEAIDQPLSNLRNWVCSGEQLHKELVEKFFECFEEGKYRLHNFYGCTEVMGDVLYFTCETKKQVDQLEKIPIGIPLSNTVIYILDQDYRPLKRGEVGRIFVAGNSLANGYVNGRDPEKFIENPFAVEEKFSLLYYTGDFGALRNGNIYFHGRVDSQIKIRGHRIDLMEVEKTILSVKCIDKAIVLCYHADQIDQELLAFVQLNASFPCLTGPEIEAILKTKLQDYMVPQVILVDTVPLLVNGKVDRQSLLKLYEAAKQTDKAFDLSRFPDDQKLIASDILSTIASVIGRSTRGTLTGESNFFEMGGNSLNSIVAIKMLREKGYHIEISDFISAKNLGEIIHMVAKKSMKVKEASKVSRLNMKAVPLCADDKEDFINILADSFYLKGDLEYWIKDSIKRQDFVDIFKAMWNDVLTRGYSFTVKDMNTQKTIGIAVNFDAGDEPVIKVDSSVDKTFEITEVIEAEFRENEMPKGLNKVLYSSLLSTNICLSPEENVACVYFIEAEVIKLAKRNNFVGILTSNTSPITQQLSTEVFNYRCIVNYQANKYVYKDGTRPFEKAPDSLKYMVSYKELK